MAAQPRGANHEPGHVGVVADQSTADDGARFYVDKAARRQGQLVGGTVDRLSFCAAIEELPPEPLSKQLTRQLQEANACPYMKPGDALLLDSGVPHRLAHTPHG